jgi:hypothetical protein
MTAAEEFASRLRDAVTLVAGCRDAVTVGSAGLEVTSSQLAAVFDGSSSATAEIVVVSLAEARDKLNAAMTILTSAAQDLHIYMAQVLGSPPGDTAAPSSVVIRDENLGLTEPSRPPDSKAVPEGEPETAPRASGDVQESLEFQNRTAPGPGPCRLPSEAAAQHRPWCEPRLRGRGTDLRLLQPEQGNDGGLRSNEGAQEVQAAGFAVRDQPRSRRPGRRRGPSTVALESTQPRG